MQLISAGAAQTVTGSCHHLSINGKTLLIDCGLFQGGRALESRNFERFPFSVSDVDAVLITHGHLDHIGRLPLLFKQGYRGPVYATESTVKIAEIILQDSARIQQEDFKRALKKARRNGTEDKVTPALYTPEDIPVVMQSFKTVAFEQPLDLGSKVIARFFPAGHILGSAFIELDSPEGRIIFSGDLGNRESAVQEDATLPRDCDAVVIETTYANRTHRSLAATLEEFTQVLTRSVKAGGNIMIPSFALERTQNILYHLKNLQMQNKIPSLPIFLDSPMASKMTWLYQDCANEFVPDVARKLERNEHPFEPNTLTYTLSADESKEINNVEGGAIIVAGSGMMTGGRIRHHLKHNLWRKEASLVIVGYQAEGTLGRLLIDGVPRVKLFGEEIIVNASIHTIGGFSAHADQDDLLRWLKPTKNARVYMVHGEVPVMEDFKATLAQQNRDAHIVVYQQAYTL